MLPLFSLSDPPDFATMTRHPSYCGAIQIMLADGKAIPALQNQQRPSQ